MPKAKPKPASKRPEWKGWCELCQADPSQRDEPRGDLCGGPDDPGGYRYICDPCLRSNQRVTV